MAVSKSIMKTILRFLYGGDGNVAPETKNVLLVLATLIVATTFQAGVNPPGGVWQDTVHSTPVERPNSAPSPSPAASPTYNLKAGRVVLASSPPPLYPNNDDDHEVGRAVFAKHRLSFIVFLLSNTLAFSWSIHFILHLMVDGPFFRHIFVATTAMMATYWSAIYEITPDEVHKYRFILCIIAFPYLIQIYLSIVERMCGQRSKERV